MQKDRTQVAQKTLRKKEQVKSIKKTTGEKHRVSLYFSRDIHPIFPKFLKLIFKAVNANCVDDIKRKPLPVIYNSIMEQMLSIMVLKGGFFNLKLCPQVIVLLSTADKCSNHSSNSFNT